MVKAYKLGIVIGEPTAGTNGNIVRYDSIAGTTIHFTGMRVLNPDRTLLHGRGVPVDILVQPSIEGIIAGRDEILDRAIQIAN